MLESARPVGFIPTCDPERARAFYEGVLGLRVLTLDAFALVLDAHGILLRVVNVAGSEGFRPQPFTIFGWSVPDARAAVTALAAKGVTFKRYPGMEQDELGIWASPGGARVAWFEDPDGNVLSVSSHD
ncbi:MAG TPA: VOC family protein [Longimicrobiales bacterium]